MASSSGAPGAASSGRAGGTDLPGTSYRLVRRLDDPRLSSDGDEVWGAHHRDSGVPYAIKLLSKSDGARERLAERMQRVEARMQTGLSHPNLVRVFDLGITADGRPFLVLDKLAGQSARAEVRARGHLPLLRALEVVAQLCDGLHAAHGAGAVHRRVRPESVFLCDDGTVKLLGFGKILDVGIDGHIAPQREPDVDAPYTAPEIVEGPVVDGRADVYSAGAVLYELLTGKPPCASRRTRDAQVSPPSVTAEQLVPAEVDALVLAAISFDPERRPPTAGAFAAELGAVVRRISAGSGAARPAEAAAADLPTKWAKNQKQQLGAAGEQTAVFSLGPEHRSGGENVYTIVAGTMLAGKYRVARVIGKGGMGLVVEARHIHLDTRVAMKFLLPEFMSYAEASSRFLREARAASKLTSHHVARVLDVGTLDAGEPYMVMEYLAGEDLAYHAHARTPVTLGEAIDYVTQASDAIAEAHQLGIVHRDVKPANLFLTRRADGTPMVKVLDFGISKVIGEGERDVALTQTTTILGSALYMSPEQMQSAKHVDRRTDIYALGVCLFELIGRELPYFADSFPELCAKVFTSLPKSLRSLRPEVPEGLQAAIERALARDPAKRYQTVCELLQALSPYARLDTRARMEVILRRHEPQRRLLAPAAMAATVSFAVPRPPPAPPEAPRPRRSLVPMVAAVCALAVAGGLGWRAWRQRAAEPPVDAAIAVPAADTVGRGAVPGGDPVSEPSSAQTAGAVAAQTPPLPDPPPEAPVAAPPQASTAAPTATATARSAAAPPRPTGGTQKPAALDRAASPPAVPPPATTNTDLVQETCKARMPDGTEKIVPCN